MTLSARGLIAAAAFLAAQPAGAAPMPLLFPTHDVTLDYAVAPAGEKPIAVRVAVAAGGRQLRITSDMLPTTILVNRDTGMADIVLPMVRMYSALPIGRYDPQNTVLKGARFQAAGQARVAGRACTEWHAQSEQGRASACITPDGLILRGSVTNQHGRDVTILATAVLPGPVPRDQLTVPPGFQPSPFKLSLKGIGQ